MDYPEPEVKQELTLAQTVVIALVLEVLAFCVGFYFLAR